MNGPVLETFLFLNSLLADDIRPSRKDVKVTAVCQSLTNLLRGTTYGLRVSASFLRSAPGPAGGRSPGGTGAIEERAGLNNGLGPEVCAMETVGYMDCWCSFGAPNLPN